METVQSLGGISKNLLLSRSLERGTLDEIINISIICLLYLLILIPVHHGQGGLKKKGLYESSSSVDIQRQGN